VFIEAGTVHALGAGLLIAEIQQASNTTFRLFDWNRVDRDGKPRPLHINESLTTIDFSRGPVKPQIPQRTDRQHVERLVKCEKFILDRWTVNQQQRLPSGDQFHIVATIDGNLTVSSGGRLHVLQRGDTLVIPASCDDVQLVPQGRAVALDMYLP
jgi:mannose-6-phosphate isomerase